MTTDEIVKAQPPAAGAGAEVISTPRDDVMLGLEAEILANPTSQDAYLAYGDYLSAQGDPRGEMVAIGRALANNPDDKAMLERRAELEPSIYDKHLDDIITNVDWYMGFMRRARIGYTTDRFNGDVTPDVRLVDVLAWLLDGPGKFLQDLTVGLVHHEGNRYGAIAAAIGRAPRALRRLFLGDFDRDETELNWTELEDLSPIWPMCQDLRDVTLRGGSMTIGSISLPNATSFSTITGGLSSAALGDIASADWPELVELSVQIGSRGTMDLAPLKPLLDAERVPRLKKLGLKNTRAGDDVLRALAGSKLLRQLEELDVSMSLVEEQGFEVLDERFAHLKKLRLGGDDVDERELPGLNVVWEERYGPVFE